MEAESLRVLSDGMEAVQTYVGTCGQETYRQRTAQINRIRTSACPLLVLYCCGLIKGQNMGESEGGLLGANLANAKHQGREGGMGCGMMNSLIVGWFRRMNTPQKT